MLNPNKKQTTLTTTLLLLLASQVLTDPPNLGYSCSKTVDGALYNFNGLKVNSSKPYVATDTQVTVSVSGAPMNVSATYYFNFCGSVTDGNVLSACSPYVDDPDITAFMVYTTSESAEKAKSEGLKQTPSGCVAMSQGLSKMKSGQQIATTEWSYSLWDTTTATNGIVITGNNSKAYQDSNTDYPIMKNPIKLVVTCTLAKNQKPTAQQNKSAPGMPIELIVASPLGCGSNIFGPLAGLIRLGWPLALFGMLLGIVMIPVGKRYFKIALSIISLAIM